MKKNFLFEFEPEEYAVSSWNKIPHKGYYTAILETPNGYIARIKDVHSNIIIAYELDIPHQTAQEYNQSLVVDEISMLRLDVQRQKLLSKYPTPPLAPDYCIKKEYVNVD